jgi:hypothetical protein
MGRRPDAFGTRRRARLEYYRMKYPPIVAQGCCSGVQSLTARNSFTAGRSLAPVREFPDTALPFYPACTWRKGYLQSSVVRQGYILNHTKEPTVGTKQREG